MAEWIHYDEPLFRPPSEAYSAIVQATYGCSHNKCAFCMMYKTKRFRARSVQDVKQDMDVLASLMPEQTKLFLADGDALVLSTGRLLAIMEHAYKVFPRLKRVTSYANPSNLLHKSRQELRELHEAGLKMVYLGLESGDDEILRAVKKGATSKEVIEACTKAREAGIAVSVTVLLGLGGRERSRRHAQATARALTSMDPDYASALTLMLGPMEKKFATECAPWTRLSPRESLQELKTMIEGFDAGNTVFRTNHASNYLALRGTLPGDKQALLALIDAALSDETGGLLRPEWARGL